MSNRTRIIKIISGSYTSEKRANQLVSRGVATWADDHKTSIQFRTVGQYISHVGRRSEIDPVNGKFEWKVGNSGGYQIMKADHTDK